LGVPSQVSADRVCACPARLLLSQNAFPSATLHSHGGWTAYPPFEWCAFHLAGDVQDDRKSALSHISSLFGGSKHGGKGPRQQKDQKDQQQQQAHIPVAVNPWEWGESYDEKVDIWQVRQMSQGAPRKSARHLHVTDLFCWKQL
jgi:hypothetical protein